VDSHFAGAIAEHRDPLPSHGAATVGFLSAPVGDAPADSVTDVSDAASSADAIGEVGDLDDGALLAAALEDTVILDRSVILGADAELDAGSELDADSELDTGSGIDADVGRETGSGGDAYPPPGTASPAGTALPEGTARPEDTALPAGTTGGGTLNVLTDIDVSVTPGTNGDSANSGAQGEPFDPDARRTGVTETLTAGALLPELVRAPQAAAAQARPASAAWDASEVVTEIYTAHYNHLVRLALLLVHDLQTAEEVVQDAFEAMHKAWRRLRDSDKALSYLRQTVVNRSRSVLRHRKVVDLHPPKPAPDEPSAEHAALALIERSAVASALGLLPVRQREAIVLRYYADLSEADIAQAMGISRGAVKSHTARAMASLKSILEQETP
jgi:RNA polymerase sigma-70 factor (sigma-E family)